MTRQVTIENHRKNIYYKLEKYGVTCIFVVAWSIRLHWRVALSTEDLPGMKVASPLEARNIVPVVYVWPLDQTQQGPAVLPTSVAVAGPT